MHMDLHFELIYLLMIVAIGLVVLLSFLVQPTPLRRLVKIALLITSVLVLISFGALIQGHPDSSFAPKSAGITAQP